MSISDFSIRWYSVIVTTNDISDPFHPAKLASTSEAILSCKASQETQETLIRWSNHLGEIQKHWENTKDIWRRFSGFTENINHASACCLLLRWLWRWHCLKTGKANYVCGIQCRAMCNNNPLHHASTEIHLRVSSYPKHDKETISLSAGVLHELWGMIQCKSKTLCMLHTGTSWFSFHLCASTCAGLAAV